MPNLNTKTAYGRLTRGLHWVTALLILANIGLGLAAAWAPFNSTDALAHKTWLFSLHKTMGVALFFVALIRLIAGCLQTRPDPLGAHHDYEILAAKATHWMLYCLLVMIPLSGWIHHAAAEGFAPILWPLGQSLPFVPKSPLIFDLAGAVHNGLVIVLIGTLALHVAGTLKHAVVDRDGTLRRMVTGHPSETGPPPPAARLVPLLSGLALVAAVTISGWAISEAESTRKARITSSTDQSAAWTVSEGVLQITIQQLGAPITGTFESWTADIAFSTPSNARPNGQVKVTIDISSLELGIVSAQAMGPDFFDAERFPTAVFDARIRASDENYVANGTLTLKGITHPVRMPFLMTIEDGVATMTARHVLNRTDFDIGRSFSDESQLGFDVTVDIELSARRAP